MFQHYTPSKHQKPNLNLEYMSRIVLVYLFLTLNIELLAGLLFCISMHLQSQDGFVWIYVYP